MGVLEELVVAGWRVRSTYFPPVIHFAYPTQTTAISVTGDRCELNCGHCGGHYLKKMLPLSAVEPEKLGESCLISGGSSAAGKVPLIEHLPRLAAIKAGRRFNLHVGLIDNQEITAIAKLADVISFDFVGDDLTIREVFGIDRTVDDYAACYTNLRRYCRVIPHICIGLHGGAVRGEYRALELLKDLGADGLTFIVFVPTRGTRYADRQPPTLPAVIELLAAARLLFPLIPFHLGCMRPGGLYRNELDQWAVRLGINTIVNPTPGAVRLAEGLGLRALRGEECCIL